MEILMLNLFVVFTSSFCARLNPLEKHLECNHKKYNKIFILIALISLILVSGFRYKSGTDFDTYTENFRYSNSEAIAESDSIAFDYMCLLLKEKVIDNPQIMFLLSASITNILIVWNLKKYSTRFELSMWLYITTFTYYSTFNGVRQWMASAIVLCGTRYLLYERDFKRYLVFVLLASTFHASVLVMIPLYFIINSNTFSKRNLMIILGFMFAVFAYSKFLTMLFSLLEGTQYAHYFEIMEDASNGINPLRLLVYFMPVGMYLKFYNNFNKNKDICEDRLLNICIIGFLIMFLALKNVFFARLIYYFDLYYLLLIPKLLNIEEKSYRRFLYYSIMIGYFCYSYMLLRAGDAWIVPYTFKFTLF